MMQLVKGLLQHVKGPLHGLQSALGWAGGAVLQIQWRSCEISGGDSGDYLSSRVRKPHSLPRVSSRVMLLVHVQSRVCRSTQKLGLHRFGAPLGTFGMLHAGVARSVLICNVSKTKLPESRFSRSSSSTLLAEATPCLRSLSYRTQAPSGRAVRLWFSAGGALDGHGTRAQPLG